MIEETVFTKDTIISVVKEKYGIGIKEITKINRGSANIYSLNNETYILKEFQSKINQDDVTKEINVINHLRKDNLLVPEYIPTLDNKYSFLYMGKTIILQKFITGYTMEANTGDFEQTMESAKYLGKIAKSLETLEFELPFRSNFKFKSKEEIENKLTKIKALLNGITKEEYPQIYSDLNGKIAKLQYIVNNVNLDDMDNLTMMNTHGDYNVLQFIYKNGKVHSIIDFASACKMPIVWEVIRSYSYIDAKAKDGEIDIDNLICYVKEFIKYVPLNKYDLKYMPYFYLIQILCSTYGYKEYINDNSKKNLLEFAFFRTKLSNCLFDKAEEISQRLLDL